LIDPSFPVDESRKLVGVITQDPVIFGNSPLRYNLDPFNEFSDEACVEALKMSGLAHRFTVAAARRQSAGCHVEDLSLPTSPSSAARGDKDLDLSFFIDDSGGNLSVGERQLLCLARVLLRSPLVLLCDEATASVDPETDLLVQRSLREWLRVRKQPCCVLTIAHRLETIRDYDKVLYLANGRVTQHASPEDLMALGPGTPFYDLVESAGPETLEMFSKPLAK